MARLTLAFLNVYALHLICAAVHLPQVLSSGAFPAYSIHVVLNSSDFENAGRTVYDFQPGGASTGYRILFSNECPNDTFSMDQDTGQLMIAQTVEFSIEGQEPKCVRSAPGYVYSIRTYNCFVVIDNLDESYGMLMVVDVAPNFPNVQIEFQQEFYSSEIMEGVQGESILGGGGIQAMTLPINGLLMPRYRILNDYSTFAASEHEVTCDTFLQIHNTQVLDRETQDYYEIIVEAYTSQTSANTTIVIHILDRNDNDPEFLSPAQNATVTDNLLNIGAEVTVFQATDQDSGVNARTLFSLTTEPSPFTINPFTGSLYRYSSRNLTQTTQAVKVSDLGNPQLAVQTSIDIFIASDRQQLPDIHALGTPSVSESDVIGHVVTTIRITYSSSSDISVSLESFDCNCFALSGLVESPEGEYSVELHVNSLLDYESFPNGVQVLITASDTTNAQLSTFKEFNITITDENEPPVFPLAQYELTVLEGIPIGSKIIRLLAEDPDSGTNGELTYTFTSVPENTLLTLNSSSGIFHTVGDIDYESVASIQLVVTAEDRLGETDTVGVAITILDRNDQKPLFPNSEELVTTVSEDVLANESFFDFSASDGDSRCNGAVSYSIVHADPPAFRVDSVSGLLYPLEDDSLNFEQFQDAKLIVRAMDLGEDSSEFSDATLRINIMNVNDEPPQMGKIQCPCFMEESVSTMQQCQLLSAHDADTNNLAYIIQSGTDQAQFSINTQTGVVSTSAMLNYEDRARYALDIVASDGDFMSEPQTLNITVVDHNNRAPQYTSSAIAVTSPIDTPIGSLVGNLSAQHNDAGYNALTEYKLITTSGVTDILKLDSLSGLLYLKSTPQIESPYTFSVTATDILNPANIASASVTVTFSGERNNPPYFMSSIDHIDIASNSQTNNEQLYRIPAVDDDEGTNGALTYSLTSSSDFFDVQTDGDLVLTHSLSDEVGSEFTLSVLVSDGGSPSLSDSLQLKVTVYESTLQIGGQTFQHNPGLGVQHGFANIPESHSLSLAVSTLPEMQGGSTVAYAILPEGQFYNAFTVVGNVVNSQAGNQDVFDRMSNEAVFVTLRAQYGGNFHYYSLTVVVTDVNNNGPEFEQDQYSIEIYRNISLGAYIFTFDARDPDIGSNAITSYSIASDTSPFSIVPDTAFLEVVDELRESSYSLSIVATDPGISQSATTILEIAVLETVNNPPSIPPDVFTVSESAGVGSVVGTLTVNDMMDSGMHGNNVFCIASGDTGNNFRVNQNGDIIIQSQLDYETRSSFTLTIMAYDSSPNPEYSSTDITISIEDENENPKFTTTKYFATIVENNPITTSVLTVTAIDDDSGTAGDVEYSILNGISSFSVNPVTGEVSTQLSLNRESTILHSFTVAATDRGGLMSTALVQVSVLDENDNDPSFISPNTANPVNEDTSVGTQIFLLEAVDNDMGGNGSVQFEIAGGNEENIFSLDSFTGSLVLSRSLDFETDPHSIELQFIVSDLGTPPRTSSVTHRVTFPLQNANDNFPIFSSTLYTCSIRDGSSSFESPCQVSATDADAVANSVIYNIKSGNVGQAFEINPQTGILTPRTTIDRESTSRYILIVQASDSDSPSLSSATVLVIEVLDENDQVPLFDPIIHDTSSLSEFNFPELLPHNTFLFFAHAVDYDVGENSEISYHIISGNTDLFRIDANTSAVFLAGAFDFESDDSHELTIQATNPSGTSTPHTYTINILNVNENLSPPVFSLDSAPAITIPETAAIGAHLTTVNATDTDPGPDGEVRYYITGGSGYGYFTIDQLHGNISVSYSLTGIETAYVTLQIMVTDQGNPPLSSAYNLLVILEPDPDAKPFFTGAQFTIFAPETSFTVGQVFGNVQAFVNGNPSSDVSYCIVSGNEDNKFSINSSTGAISKTITLDRETESLYTLVVNASRSDVANSASFAVVAIPLADDNDFSPSFDANFDVTIHNNHPTGLGNAFMRIFARDEDAGQNGRLEYSITSGDDHFAIDSSSGDMYLTQTLPTTGSQSYDISLSVADMGSLALTGSTTFTISVTSPASTTNNDSPIFSSPSDVVNVSEDAAPGTLVHTVQASDTLGDLLVYRIDEPVPNFAILPNSGEVYLIKPLDREDEAQYTLNIKASDGSLTSSTFLLNIVVTDVNDNRPTFTADEFVFTVTENALGGTVVGHLTADDIDDASTLTYSLVDSQHPSSFQLFSLTSDGVLHTAGDIDREVRPVHILTVAAEDDGTPPLVSYARVQVRVTDINDHSPEFQSPLSSVSISENATVGTPLLNISVFDPDTGVRGSFSYSLSPANAPFAINESTGELYVASELDAEQQNSYSLVINVANQDTPSMATSLSLQVSVADELDSLPVLTNPGTVHIPENQPAYSIVDTVAGGVSLSSVYYDITSGNDEGHFFIESLTGIIRTSVPLDRETIASYSLTIQGAFAPNYETSITVTVMVDDENDEAPFFSARFLEYTLPENSPVSVPLFRLNFTDKDEGTNSQIGDFNILDPVAAKTFRIDSSGNLRLLESLDREGKFDSISFELYIIDSGDPPLYDLARLSILVSDVNDNSPSFLESSYDFVVSLPVLVDTTLFRVEAADIDETATIRYSIIGGNGTETFSINAISGGISITDNYKLQPYYDLTVSASDGEDRDTSISVSITTKYCGFNDLIFDPRDISVRLSENSTIDTVIFISNVLTFGSSLNLMFSFSIDDPLFQINNDTGVVKLKRPLDRENEPTHYLSVQARDVDNPDRLAQADLEIIVTDVNDNAPQFQSAPYEIYITDSHSSGSAIFRVQAVDQDKGANGEITYHLESGASTAFDINENTGVISLLSDLETLVLGTHIVLTVKASDKGEPQMSEQTTVTVNVVDSNAPLFTMDGVYSAQINESVPRDTEVITVRAEATSANPIIVYTIESPQSPNLPFSIDFTEGRVTVNGIGLDFETNSSYRLQLRTIDLSTSLEGRATLDIQVIDVNDNRPEFNMALYGSNVTENSAIGTSVNEVSAMDRDSGENSDIAYFIDPNDIGATLFHIDEDTGLITTSAIIDREQNAFIEFSVLAKDSGNPPLTGTTTVRVAILDLNDNTPTFLESSYRETVSEDDSPGTSILFVTATDLDDGTIDYDIVGSSSHFAISSGGLLTLTTAASQLTEYQYILNISASDGELYGYTRVVIELEVQNNHAPMFNQTIYNAYVVENATMGTYVTQVYATDDDRGSNADLTYLVSDDQFAVGPQTGIITVSGALDRESITDGVAMLIVIARDGGGRTGTTEVHVELGDINDNRPTFSSSTYMFEVLQSDPIGTTVSTAVVATDPDDELNGDIQYSLLVVGDQSQFPFAIDELTGALTTRLDVDPDVQVQYTFTVNAEDNGSPRMSADPAANVTIHVIADGQEPPRFENQTYTLSIPEGDEYFREIILTVHLIETNESVDCNAVVFSLTDILFVEIRDDDATDYSADLELTSVLDREDEDHHTFFIRATCIHQQIDNPTVFINSLAFAEVIVNVLDINEAPTFGSTTILLGSVMENIPLGTILQFRDALNIADDNINAVRAIDEDIGTNGMIRYSISNDGDDVPFDVDQVTGIISVDGELDRETEDSYQFIVLATDLGDPQLSASLIVIVSVEDINDSPPVFEQTVYYAEVSEDAEISTSLITVAASDEDTELFTNNIYSVSNAEFFNIISTTGELITTRYLDRETTSMHAFQIRANDGVNEANTSIIINVTDINDNPPIFNPRLYAVTRPENYAVNVTIIQVFATDEDIDENAEISFNILEDQQVIHIDNSTGEVSFAQTPDYELSAQGHYEFQVRAFNLNNENMRDLVALIIELQDLNDNAPLFSEEIDLIQVSENRPAGTTVERVVAVDFDSGSNSRLEYALGPEAQEYFEIDSLTGIITTKVMFDREMNSSFELTVIATDSGSPPLSSNISLPVSISDQNDNRPIFPKDNYTIAVLEGVATGTVIQTVVAEDADAGSNAEITYILMGDNSAHFVLIAQDDGDGVAIQVAQIPNREQIPVYDLSIEAFDGGSPAALSSMVSLTIMVLDENDNPPMFLAPFHVVTEPENLTLGSEIIRVEAKDPDSAETTRLTYSILEADMHPQFEIDINDGRITLAQLLDYETEQSHTMIVQVYDQVHSATATVIVRVTNINDNAPEFTMPNYTTTVVENDERRELFNFKFMVSDGDIGANSDTRSFRIESGNDDGIFTLDAASGALSVDSFDFESLSTRQNQTILVITASDNDDPPLAGTAYVTVMIQDINDNPPEGEDQVIYVFLYNGRLALDTLGTLLIRDPDTVNDHQFVVSGNNDAFSIDSGKINIIQRPPPPGVYRFTVQVTDGVLGSATTHINITVANITNAHLASSFIMQVDANTVESFLDNHLQLFLEALEDQATDNFNMHGDPKPYVFNIQPSESANRVDISVVMQSGDGDLVHPNLMQHLIHINRAAMERRLGLTIVTENVDHCADESVCPMDTVCAISRQYSSSTKVLGSAAASLAGIEQIESRSCSNLTSTCTVPCPEPSYCVQEGGRSICWDDCTPNPCRNNGMCKEQNPGYYCSCPSGYDGRNCELTTSYFKEDSYTILPAITKPTNGSIVLEFTTSDRNGLLYYSSRFDNSQNDFLALEMVDLRLSLLLSYGGENVRVSTENSLDSDSWYTAVVQYSTTVSVRV